MDHMSLEEKVALMQNLQSDIAAHREEERQAAIGQIENLMAEHGLTIADLGYKRTANVKSRKNVEAKYRDPETGETWSGRGRMVGWLKDRLSSGYTLDQFKIA